MKRIFISTLLILTTIFTAFADEVSFVASAPKSVVVGNRFKIAYEVNTKADSQPTISDVDGLRVLSGPHHSTFMSSSMAVFITMRFPDLCFDIVHLLYQFAPGLASRRRVFK